MYIVDGLLVCLLKNWFAIQDQSKKKRLHTNTLCTSIPLGTYPCLQWRSVFWSSSLIYPGCANLSTRYWFSHSQHDISCSVFNDPTLSLIARMIEKYACFKCWYLKYQSLDRKYVFIFIFSDICEEIIEFLLMEIIWIYLVHGHFMYCRNHIIVHE